MKKNLGIVLPKRIPELDGFRAIAVLMVMIEHIYEVSPVHGVSVPSSIHFLVTHGWLGVDLFFILSGFLITGILLDERDEKDYFRNFYRRRACRILPLALTCLFVFSILYEHRYDERFSLDFFLTFCFCANLNILFGVLPIPGTGVMWSLAVEEHFYLLWPLLIRKFSYSAVGCVAAAIILLSPVARGVAMHYGARPWSVYQLSWFRFDGLAMGALLAVFVRTRHFTARSAWSIALGWLVLILALTALLKPFGVLVAKSTLGEALRYTQAQAFFGAAMCIALAHQGSAWTAALRFRFLGWVAELSYCLYLVHMAIGHVYRWLFRETGMNEVFGLESLLLRYAIVLSLSFAVASISRRYLEEPFLRLRAGHARVQVA